MRILFKFEHGLGDVISFNCVMNHLVVAHPENQYFIETYTEYQPLIPKIYQPDGGKYDEVKNIFYHPGIYYQELKHLPATKASRCLFKEFGIIPKDGSLYQYSVDKNIGEFYGIEAKWLIANIDKYVCVQATGHTMRREKNLSQNQLDWILSKVGSDYKVILIDFAGEIDTSHHRNVISTKDIPFSAGNIVYLLENCSRYIGIDSGPKSIALALGKPCSVIWSLMHPYHNVEPFTNLTNWVSKQVASRLWANPGDDLVELTSMYNLIHYESLQNDFVFPEMSGCYSPTFGASNLRTVSDKLKYKLRNHVNITKQENTICKNRFRQKVSE